MIEQAGPSTAGATLVSRLHSSATRFADRTAIIHGDSAITYGDLWHRVRTIATLLRRNGLRRGDRVGLLMANSIDYVAVYYGSLAAGAVAVAFNTAAKARDLCGLLDHSECRWLFADPRHPELSAVLAMAGKRLQVIPVEAGGAVRSLGPADEVDFSNCRTEAPAAIIYTSGTTGRPKGVTLSHANLATNVDSILAYLNLNEEDRVVNVLPFSYSYGNSVLHTHLAVGGSLVLEDNMLFPHRVMESVAHHRATGFSGVPTTFALLLSRVRLEEYSLASLRYITQAGGAMAPATTAQLRKALPHTDIYVMYGQTEATARLAYLPPARLEAKLGSVGIAIPGVTLEVRDETGRPLAPNVTGEICARGNNIMLGYWRDPEATAQVIRDGWLHTGDLGHTDEEGYLYIDGRRSDMIKTGAHRVSPGEIEEAVAELPGVEEVAAVGVPDPILGQVIKCLVVARPGCALTPMAIQHHCRRQLAAHKVPKKVIIVGALPKTTSGKVQRYLLREQELGPGLGEQGTSPAL